MKLYYTGYSPYARICRIIVLEKGLEDRVEMLEAQVRTEGSPFYDVNPSGRVPYLQRQNGPGLEGSSLIACYLDRADGNPIFGPWDGKGSLEVRRLEMLGRSLMDGTTNWAREIFMHPEEHRAPKVLAHEKARATRMLDQWDREIDNPLMHGALNIAQITMIAALQMNIVNTEFKWRDSHPKLSTWFAPRSERPSVQATQPPGAMF